VILNIFASFLHIQEKSASDQTSALEVRDQNNEPYFASIANSAPGFRAGALA
jgi:hypothetical protein